jgi:hypothetical protein
MTLDELKALFARAGATKLYAKSLAENDNSKNQIYFAGAVELLNAFPSRKIDAVNSESGPTFKANLEFGWLLPNASVAPAPHAQLILYPQYPEVRFSGFLRGCNEAPRALMADRQRAASFPPEIKSQLIDRVLFIGVTNDRQIIGYVAPGNSHVATEFRSGKFPPAFVVFQEIQLPAQATEEERRSRLIAELGRVSRLGWIDSKQLDSRGIIMPCKASQCGGFTLEAELGIPKNSIGEPDFLGWEIKQHNVPNFSSLGSAITLMTPEPTGGFYKDEGAEAFVRKYGYPDKNGKPDRLNFGGIHRVGMAQKTTGLKMTIIGYDMERREITNAEGMIGLIDSKGNIAASWAFAGLLSHWSKKHMKAAYVPSMSRREPAWQYSYGPSVRLAQDTDSLKLLAALASGIVYYDPGIKLENASTSPRTKRRSQFRVASKNIAELYRNVTTISV